MPTQPAPTPGYPPRRSKNLTIAVLVFFGSLFGTLIGVAADFSDAEDTLARLRSSFYPELCVVGSDTILGEALGYSTAVKAAFEERINSPAVPGDVRVTMEAIGSLNGVARAVSGGCVHVLASSEPLQSINISELVGAGVSIDCAAEIGYDVVAFVTDINNPVPALPRRDLGAILEGRIGNWAEINRRFEAPINILYRPGSGTTDFVFRNLIGHTDANLPPPGAIYQACGSNEDCLNATLSTRGSLYWVSTAWMRTQPPEYLRVLPILTGDEAPINPLADDVDITAYPAFLVRPLYMYVLRRADTPPETSRLAREFLSFVRSVNGQQLLEARHFYTYFAQPRDVALPLPPDFTTDGGGQRVTCLPAA